MNPIEAKKYPDNHHNYAYSRFLVSDILSSRQTLEEEDLAVIGDELKYRRTEDLSSLTAEEQAQIIRNGSAHVLPETQLESRLAESKQSSTPLQIKYGIDPTAADVHLGHAVPMILLDRIRRMGHQVSFVIGDVTARIGDPSGRVASRPILTDEQITKNMTTYSSQVRPIFDMSKVVVSKNSSWLNDYPLRNLLAITAKIPAMMLLQRNDFRKRIEDGSGITQAEMLYPIVMALDSVQLDTDIEIGGKDQFLNMQMCRTVMEICGKNPEIIITTDLLEGTDGKGSKMSKSLNNYVALTQDPSLMFGKLMSIPDRLIPVYFSMLTELEQSEWVAIKKHLDNGLNPMKIKELLASDIVRLFHGNDAAIDARKRFVRQFSTKDYLGVLASSNLVINSSDGTGFIEQIAISRKESKSAIMRIIRGGGLSYINKSGNLVKANSSDLPTELPEDIIGLKIGKTIFRVNTRG